MHVYYWLQILNDSYIVHAWHIAFTFIFVLAQPFAQEKKAISEQ